MKKKVSLFGILILLIIIGIYGGVEAYKVLAQEIGMMLSTIKKVLINVPTDLFDVIKSAITDNWSLTNIVWLDFILLLFVAGFSSLITFQVFKKDSKKSKIFSGIFSFVVYVLVLFLFSSILFWIILGVLLIVGICLHIKTTKNIRK